MSTLTATEPYYKSLIVCGKRLRSQWNAEIGRFFPGACARLIEAKGIDKSLAALHADAVASDRPLIAIVSYETVTKKWETLKTFFDGGDELIVDEAVILKNPNSQRSKGLWEIRSVIDIAVTLTGTPIEKSVDDMGAILAFTRNDRDMFRGMRLHGRFGDVSQDGVVEAFTDAVGPVVFRRDRSEIADELPSIQTETILLDPEPAELALADAARNHLRGILKTLTEKVEALSETDPSDERLRTIGEELRRLRGAVLGGVTLARMAACDPIAVAESDSAGAKLLAGEGLVAPAVKTGGTKRQQIVALTDELVQAGESVLIFTDFSTVADHLVSDLKARGVRVGAIKGGMTDKATDDAQHGFQGAKVGVGSDVKYDVLVLTSCAKEGLNLQRASVLVHYDLPWLPSSMVQRVGRASRIGSTAETLQVLIPVMAGTIEERAAVKLVTRAITALALLDGHRGVEATQTEIGQALAGLADAVSEDEIEDGDEGMIAMARELIG